MLLSTLLVALPLVGSVLGVKTALNCKKPPTRDGDPGSLPLYTRNSIIYIVNVTIAGSSYPLQLDTGSSDLWAVPSRAFPGVHISDVPIELKYGTGFAQGHVATGPVSFAGFDIDKQAFINITAADNPVFSNGAVGIVGVGFTSLSQIDGTLTQMGEDWGKSLLYNIFAQYPQEPNFIAFYLKRSEQPDVYVEGSFTIGEVEPEYQKVMQSKELSTWPVHNPTRWNVLVDGYSFKNSAMKPIKSNVKGVPSGKSVALLDSGTSFLFAPTWLLQEIVASIPEAKKDKSSGVYSVPCDTELDLAFYFAGEKYPIDPQDIVLEENPGQCILAMSTEDNDPEMDFIFGDVFLRSVYSLYDFGDFVDGTTKMGDPYVKLLSIVNPEDASREFQRVRGSGNGSSGSGKSSSNDSDPDSSDSDPDQEGQTPDSQPDGNDNDPQAEPDNDPNPNPNPDDTEPDVDSGPGVGNVGGVSNDSDPSSSASHTIQDVYNKLQSGAKYLGFILAVIGVCALLIGCACGAAIMAILGRRKSRGVGSREFVLPLPTTMGQSTTSLTKDGAGGVKGSYAPVSMYNEDTGRHEYEEPKYGHGGH